MKRLKKIIVLFLAVLMVLPLCSCKHTWTGAEFNINSDGTGYRKLVIYIPKNDKDENGVGSYEHLKMRDVQLRNWLTLKYIQRVPGSHEWLTVTVDDSGANEEIVYLSFSFSSFEDYVSKLKSMAYDPKYASTFKAPEIIKENGRIVYYEESINVTTSIIYSIRDEIGTDSGIYNMDYGNDISEGFKGQEFVADYWYNMNIDGKKAVPLAPKGDIIAWCAEGSENKYDLRLTATEADEWTNLFLQYGKGSEANLDWLGADGIYSFAFDGKDSYGSVTESTKTLFFFNDTLMGYSDANGNCTYKAMPQNTAATMVGMNPVPSGVKYFWGKNGTNSRNEAVMADKVTRNILGGEYWNADGLIMNNTFYIFARDVSSVWSGADNNHNPVSLFSFPIVNGNVNWSAMTEQKAVPQLLYVDPQKEANGEESTMYFGCAVFANTTEADAPNPDEYIYIYGQKYGKKSVVSRIHKNDFPDMTKLRYWNGTSWGTDISQTADLFGDVSTEYSVSYVPVGPYAGKYIAVWTEGSVSGDIMYSIGDSLAGPFDTPVCVYNCYDTNVSVIDREGKNTAYMIYNAKAHPHLSYGDKLLVSYNYNVISGANTTYSYCPRFIWIDLSPVEDGLFFKENCRYSSEEGYIKNVVSGDTSKKLISSLYDRGVSVKNQSGNVVSDNTILGTGYTAEVIENGEVKASASVVVKGDITGEGEIDSSDLLRIKAIFLDMFNAEGAYLEAADVDENGKVDTTDYLRVKSHFLKTFDIYA